MVQSTLQAERETVQVAFHAGTWAVRHNGVELGRSRSREEMVAFASKLARSLIAAGSKAQIVVSGERATARSSEGSSLEWD